MSKKGDAPAPGKLSQVPGAVRQAGARKKDNPMPEMLANTHYNYSPEKPTIDEILSVPASASTYRTNVKRAAEASDTDGEPKAPGRERLAKKRAKTKAKAKAWKTVKKTRKAAVAAADQPTAEEGSSSSGGDDDDDDDDDVPACPCVIV